MTRTLSVLIALSAALAACAPVEEGASGASAAAAQSPLRLADERSCFSQRRISGYREAPDSPRGGEQIFVDVGAEGTYLFETLGACPSLGFTTRIAVDQRAPGPICHGSDVDLIVPDPALGAQRCSIRMIGKLAEGEGRR